MAIGGYIGKCLADLLGVITTELPLQIDLMNTAETITMLDPYEYSVEMEDRDRSGRLPRCIIWAEGSSDTYQEWGGTQQIIDYTIPAILVVYHHHALGAPSNDMESMDRESYRYARCLQEAAAKRATTVSGVYRASRWEIEIGRWGANERYGFGAVRSDLIYRTTLQRPT